MKAIFLTVMLLVSTAILWTLSLLESQNILLESNWRSSKRMLSEYTMGARETILSRVLLAGHTLHLGPLYGYQEITSKWINTPEKVIFEFSIPSGSYLDFVYNGNDETQSYQGLRISRDLNYPNMFYKSNKDGRFLESERIELPSIEAGWHNAILERKDGFMQLSIDQNMVWKSQNKSFTQGFVGFHGSFLGADISYIKIKTIQGQWINDSFFNTQNWKRYLKYNTLFLFVLILTVFFTSFLFKTTSQKRIKSVYLFTQKIFLVSLMWFAFDFFYYAKLTTIWEFKDFPTSANKTFAFMDFEKIRFNFFEMVKTLYGVETHMDKKEYAVGYPQYDYSDLIYCTSKNEPCRRVNKSEVERMYSKKKNSYRVLLLGSSFSLGRGANGLENTFFAQTHKYLKEQVKPLKLESLNYSVSGHPGQSVSGYYEFLHQFKPDLVILSLMARYDQRLQQLISFNLQHQAKTLIILGPDNIDVPEEKKYKESAGWTPHWSPIMKFLALKDGADLVDFNSITNSVEMTQTGFIWWDEFHMTNYGHSLVAQLLGRKVLSLLKNQNSCLDPYCLSKYIDDSNTRTAF